MDKIINWVSDTLPSSVLDRTDEVIDQRLFAAAHNVRFWHKADIAIVLIHVCFRG